MGIASLLSTDNSLLLSYDCAVREVLIFLVATANNSEAVSMSGKCLENIVQKYCNFSHMVDRNQGERGKETEGGETRAISEEMNAYF